MKFKCPLIVIKNIDVARSFYENILDQKVKCDFGENVVFLVNRSHTNITCIKS